MTPGRTDDPFFYTGAKMTLHPVSPHSLDVEESLHRWGCPECGVFVLGGVHMCEAGVVAAPEIKVEFSVNFEMPEDRP